VRVRLATDLIPGAESQAASSDVPFLQRTAVREQLQAMARHDLVATIEATGDQLDQVTRLADDLPDLRIVIDHFGWPTDLSDEGRALHLERLSDLAARSNVATRLDAVGSIFGSWSTDQLRTWFIPVLERFGPERCMLGSDLPIERLRSTYEELYRAYDEVFAGFGDRERRQLAGGTAEVWYGAA
jgi:predicted TIM-barrel fold metal-dependent hydrolase